MDDTSSLPYALELVEEVELNSGSDGGSLLDRASLTEIRRKNSLTSLKMGKGKIMTMQNRRRILLALIVLVKDLTIVALACITKVRLIISRALDQVKLSPSI